MERRAQSGSVGKARRGCAPLRIEPSETERSVQRALETIRKAGCSPERLKAILRRNSDLVVEYIRAKGGGGPVEITMKELGERIGASGTAAYRAFLLAVVQGRIRRASRRGYGTVAEVVPEEETVS